MFGILKLFSWSGLAGVKAGNLVVAGLVLTASTATMASTITGAIWTDNQEVGSNAFSTGTVDIATTPSSAVVALSNMAPGDSTLGAMTVSNDGSLQLRYAVTSTTTENTLAAVLDLTIWDENAEADGGTDCNTSAPGTVLYGPGDIGNTVEASLVGSTTQGAQAGDRTLNAGTNEVLCFLVHLPTNADSAYQGMGSSATFFFKSEQIANN
jgi:hypothetical protein